MSGRRFKQATREQARLRMCCCGPAGSGKTYSCLRIGSPLALWRGQEKGREGRVFVIDTERGSASLYQGASPDGVPFEFQVAELTNFSPSEYTDLIHDAERAGADVIIIDSLSHAWEGVGGALDLVDRNSGGNKYAAWKDVTPMHRKMVDAILASPCDILVTLRARVEHVMEKDSQGNTVVKKIGLRPIQRDGMEYEFTIFADVDQSHMMTLTKSRCEQIEGLAVVKPGLTFARTVYDWLVTGAPTSAGSITGAVAGSSVDAAQRAAMVQRIVEDSIRIGWDRKRLDAEVAKEYTQRTLDSLSGDEISTLSRRLAALPTKKKATATTTPATTTPMVPMPTPAVTPTPTPAPTPAPASLPPSDPDLVEDMSIPPKKITPGQVAEITSLKAELFSTMPQGQADRNAFWKLQLAHYGVATARDMSEETAALFILRLRHEIDMRREGGDPFTNPVEVTPTPTPTATPTPDTETAA